MLTHHKQLLELSNKRHSHLQELYQLQQFLSDADEVRTYISDKLKIAGDEAYKVHLSILNHKCFHATISFIIVIGIVVETTCVIYVVRTLPIWKLSFSSIKLLKLSCRQTGIAWNQCAIQGKSLSVQFILLLRRLGKIAHSQGIFFSNAAS